eukprot:6179908-Pleurochrysis_carterae.AAC.1
MRGVSERPAKAVKTKGYSTAMALSILKNLLATQQLRMDEGPATVPESHRNERLFGVTGSGRTKLCFAGARILKLDQEYFPASMTLAFCALFFFYARHETLQALSDGPCCRGV